MAEVAQTRVSMYYLDLFPYDDIAKDGEEGKDGGEGCLPVYHKKGDMVDFQAVGKISHTGPAFISMGYDDDFVAAIYEFLRAISIEETASCGLYTYRR